MGNSNSTSNNDDNGIILGSKTTSEEACLGANLSGKVAIVTGCSSGIGIPTVVQLCKQGCTVIMANRNLDKSKAAKKCILDTLNDSNNNNQAPEAKESKEQDDTTEKATSNVTTATTATTNETKESKDNIESKTDDKVGTNTNKTSNTNDTNNTSDAKDGKDAKDAKDGSNTSNASNKYENQLILLTLDLSSLESVYNFVKSFIELNLDQRLSILINNAGIASNQKFELSKDNYELQFATNFLGHFYLTILLINYININSSKDVKDNCDLRIINVSSEMHNFGPSNMNQVINNGIKNKDGPKKEDYGAIKNYGLSKYLNIVFSKALIFKFSQKEKEKEKDKDNTGSKLNILSYSLHPGGIDTGITRELPGILKKSLDFIGKFTYKTLSQGAATTVYLACQDKSKLENGGYYVDCNLATNRLSKQLKSLTSKEWDQLSQSTWQWAELLITQRNFSLEIGNNIGHDQKESNTQE